MESNWKRRIMMFDTLLKSIIMYGAEIWGFKEYDEIKIIQRKFIK